MRIIFMGTPEFSVPTLEALIKSEEEVIGVVTQPDRPKGRGKKLAFSPVKEAALANGLCVFQPRRVKTPEFVAQLKALNPDLIVVVAFGQILSPEILSLPQYGCINVHASLLPYYRGAAPLHWAVINGETETGVTTMRMDEGLDTGDMLLQEKISISSEETTVQIHDKLAVLGAKVLVDTLQALKAGTLKSIKQNDAVSTYAPLLQKEHEIINWTENAAAIHNKIRGLNSWPGAYTHYKGKRLKIWQSRIYSDQDTNNVPGKVINMEQQEGFILQTGKGTLLILEVQPEGKQRMKAGAFARGYHLGIGDQMEEE